MNKNEFLEELRLALTGEVDEREIISQIDYYNNYITSESVSRREKEVIEELGSPYLIAKTIVDGHERVYGQTYSSFKNNKGEWDASGYSSSSPNYQKGYQDKSKSRKNTYYKEVSSNVPWYLKALIILFILFVFFLLILLGSLLIQILIWIIPIIIIVSIINFIPRLYRRSWYGLRTFKK